MKDLWNNDRAQFARLLSEIRAIGLTQKQEALLCANMDLLPDNLYKIFARAQRAFEQVKAKVIPPNPPRRSQ